MVIGEDAEMATFLQNDLTITSKTVCIHFCRLLKPHLDPQLSLNGMPIPVVEKTTFLGLIFDRKLSFIPHLHYLKEKCLKAINLLRSHSRSHFLGSRSTNTSPPLQVHNKVIGVSNVRPQIIILGYAETSSTMLCVC